MLISDAPWNHADVHLCIRYRIEHARCDPWLAVNVLADQADNRMLPFTSNVGNPLQIRQQRPAAASNPL